jgi:hypothetical protein
VRVHGDLVLGGITNQPLIVGEGYIGRCCAVTLVVGDDLYTIILPDTDATREKGLRNRKYGGVITKKLTSKLYPNQFR